MNAQTALPASHTRSWKRQVILNVFTITAMLLQMLFGILPVTKVETVSAHNLQTKMAYAGNRFTDDQIKTMPLEEINKELKNRLGANKSNSNVKPEAGLPFTIVIEELPENLSEFTVEAVSSSPAEP